MIERYGSGIRADRFFAFESPLCGDGNTASEPGALLAAIGLWALAAAGSAWMEREWFAAPGGTPMPSVPPFDPPDSVARPFPAAPPPIDR